MKRFTPTWIVILLAVVLGVVTIWTTRQAKESPQVAALRLVAIEPATVESLVFERPDSQPIVVEHKSDGWRITSPLPWKVDPIAMSSLLTQLEDLRADEKFDKPEEAATYGLDPPQLVVKVTTNQETYALEFGETAPVGWGCYARLAGKDTVFTLAADKVEAFDLDLTELRDKRILDIVVTDIQRISLRDAAGTSTVLMRQDDQWQLISPFQDEADPFGAEELAWGLGFLQATEFIDTPKDLSNYGLRKPVLQVELVTGSAHAGQTVKLTIGKVEKQPPKERSYMGIITTYYVQSSADTKTIYEIATDLSELISLKAESLINTQVFDTAWASRAQQVQLSSPEGTWTLERSGQNWKLSQPKAAAVNIDRTRTDRLLAAVRKVQLDSIERKRSTQLPSGGKNWSLQLTTIDGRRYTLLAREAADAAKWLATVDGRQHRYYLDGTLLKTLQEAFEQESK